MAVETRVTSRQSNTHMDGHDGSVPLDEGPSYVRFVCKITLQRASSRLGGMGLADVEGPGLVRTCEAKHLVDDPSIFLDYDQIRQIVWHVLIMLPGLHGLDLAPSNWDIFRPDTVATGILQIVQGNDDRGLCGGHYRFAVDMDINVTLVFSEPKALLGFCSEKVMQTPDLATTGGRCRICLGGGGLMSSLSKTPSLVTLPCSHLFHTQCIIKCLFKDTTCPLCHHDLRGLVVAPWLTPKQFV